MMRSARVGREILARTALALGVVACGRPMAQVPLPRGPAAQVQPAGAAPAADRITLERRPCFGACPVYTVTIERSGAVTVEGRRFVADTGTFTDSIPAARADSLFRELDASGWFDLADRYTMGEPGCGRFATDLPTVITEVRMDGRSKRIEHDHGCADAPAKLSALEQRIDEVAGRR